MSNGMLCYSTLQRYSIYCKHLPNSTKQIIISSSSLLKKLCRRAVFRTSTHQCCIDVTRYVNNNVYKRQCNPLNQTIIKWTGFIIQFPHTASSPYVIMNVAFIITTHSLYPHCISSFVAFSPWARGRHFTYRYHLWWQMLVVIFRIGHVSFGWRLR